MDYREHSPQIIRDFLIYHENIRGHSKKTVDEYFLDLRTFFRYIKMVNGKADRREDFENVSIMDVDLALVKSVSLSDVYDYMSFLSRDRIKRHNSPDSDYGIGAAARARKIACIRSFYKYLSVKAHLLEENPMQDLDSPRLKKSLPRYLTLQESIRLLEAVDGPYKQRDYLIITLFLNCGLRISELAGLNIGDIKDDTLRVVGKGNKERIVYLNDACLSAIGDYLSVRPRLSGRDKNALFVTRRHTRISVQAVNFLVKKHLLQAGLDPAKYSSHKLRHTAATLMLQNGVDVRTLQEVLGHEHLNTTQIYTHIDNESLRTAARANPLGKIKKG